MPPQWMSTRVLPSGFAAVSVLCSGPQSLHPPSFNFAVDSDDVGDVAGAVGVWLAAAGDGFLANLHDDYRVERVVVRTAVETVEGNIGTAGALTGTDLVTPAVAALVKLTTNAAGRRGHGRMYWPGVLGDGDVDNAGAIDLAVRKGELQDCADSLVTTLTAAAINLVLLHSYRWPYALPRVDPGPPGGFPVPTPVTGIAVQNIVGTQRRRQR